MTGARGAATASFAALGTTVGVVCADAGELPRAAAVLRARLAELDRAASRFRPDSELSEINSRSVELASREPAARLRVRVGRTLGMCLRAALRAERLTGGLVRASLGTALVACGYDDDLDVVRARGESGPAGPLARCPKPLAEPVFDERDGHLTLHAGTTLDVGASAKAWAADAIAAELAATGSGGFLVDLGGDVAVAGPPPPGGWAVGVRDWDGAVPEVVESTGQAVATSSTMLRTWWHNGIRRHHIIDPRTGLPARTRWAQVTCAGPDAVQANSASTAAIILDGAAPRWLAERGVPARLVTVDRRVVTTPGWPAGAGPAPRRAS